MLVIKNSILFFSRNGWRLYHVYYFLTAFFCYVDFPAEGLLNGNRGISHNNKNLKRQHIKES